MNVKIFLSLTTLFLVAAAVSACPPADACTEGEQRCVSGDDAVVETCENGAWVESDCPTDQNCMTMDSGIEHCMGSM